MERAAGKAAGDDGFIPGQMERAPTPIPNATGGEAVTGDVLDRLSQLFPLASVSQVYATTELGACFSVKAVPCGATTFWIPASNAVIKSSCPSHTIAELLAMSARLDLCRPKSTLPFVKSIVSGEFTYFASFASSFSTRPLNAITSPRSLQIGK